MIVRTMTLPSGLPLISRAFSASASTLPVVVENFENSRLVTFNRPKALNALDLEMIDFLAPRIQEFEVDPSIDVIIFQGAGEKAFCAGGDIKSLHDDGLDDSTRHKTYSFFEREYRLNHSLHSFSKPIVSLLNGITMGGGVGLSVHGKFRVATENTMFAMPETSMFSNVTIYIQNLFT